MSIYLFVDGIEKPNVYRKYSHSKLEYTSNVWLYSEAVLLIFAIDSFASFSLFSQFSPTHIHGCLSIRNFGIYSNTMDSRIYIYMTHVRFITIVLSSCALSLQFCRERTREKWNEFIWKIHERKMNFTETFIHLPYAVHFSIEAITIDRIDTQSWINCSVWNNTETVSHMSPQTSAQWRMNRFLKSSISGPNSQIAKQLNGFANVHFPRFQSQMNRPRSLFFINFGNTHLYQNALQGIINIIISCRVFEICLSLL